MTVDISLPLRGNTDTEQVVAFARSVLLREGVDPTSTLTITFADAAEIASLNEAHLGKTGPTDVLSFPIEDAAPDAPPRRAAGGPPLDLGDIVISEEVVAQRADEYGVDYLDELYLMVCHGVLHILGWDHITDEEASLMEARESEHLATVGRRRR